MVERSPEVRAMGLYAYEAARETVAIHGAPKRGESGWEQYRHCTRKVRYHDQPVVAVGLHAYRCNYCEGFHITGKPRTGRRKDMDRERDALAFLSQDERGAT